MKFSRLSFPMPGRSIRPTFGAGGAIVFLGVFLAVGSCAPANPAAAVSSSTREAAISRGTILAMRPVEPDAPGVGANVLSSLASAATANPAGSGPRSGQDAGQAMDFIVREAGGGTIAVVQTNEFHFQVGDPVAIVRGERTYLSRPGA